VILKIFSPWHLISYLHTYNVLYLCVKFYFLPTSFLFSYSISEVRQQKFSLGTNVVLGYKISYWDKRCVWIQNCIFYTKFPTGYKILYWEQNFLLSKKCPIEYNISYWVQNFILGKKFRVVYKISYWDRSDNVPMYG
jgi:hypothetical protein